MASLAFEHVDKIYPGGTKAIDDFTLTLAEGERLALVGPSGCGKSTLLRLLAGLDDASRGVLRIGSQVVNDLPPQRRNVAMVFQDYALYPHLTVRANLEFPLKMRDLSRVERARQIAWAADLLSLNGLLDRLPRQLSGGQRQRVAMGRALVRQPAAFLMDEPLSNLDAKLRGQIRAELSELLDRLGATTLYVTHDQVEAMTLGGRVAVLDQGRLQQVAPPQVLYARPANVFVAGFIGNPPMNLVPAQVVKTRSGLGLQVFDQVLCWPNGALERWRPWLNVPLTVGVRPEHVRLATETEPGLSGQVSSAEYLGHETLLYVRLTTAAIPPVPPLIARLTGVRPFVSGETVGLALDPERLYGFGPDGTALDPNPQALGY